MSEIDPVVCTREIPRSVEQVWRDWTDFMELQHWFWPQWPDTNYELRAEPNGQYHYHSETGQMGVNGVFTRFEPPHVLEMTWDWDSTIEASGERVLVELVEHAHDLTQLTLTHMLTDENHRAPSEQAWTDMLRRLQNR